MKTNLKKLVTLGVLTSFALIIFIIELQIPALAAIPGIKIGLANIVVLFMLFLGGRWKIQDIYALQIIRILLGAMFTSNPFAIFFSMCAGIAALTAMVIVKSLFKTLPIVLISIVGSITHNAAQIYTAAVIMDSVAVFYYFPVLIISGVISGLLTGFTVGLLFKRHPNFIAKLK